MSCVALTGGVNNLKNGIIIDNTLSDRTFGAVILYQCDPGYIATDGPYQRTCQITGSWTERPYCNEADCTSVTPPQNGIFLVANDGSTVSFTCSNGYTLTGSQTIQCNGINWSNGFPTCDIVNCGDPGIPSNGQKMGNTFTYASTVLFSCNRGCNLVGPTSIVCLSSGVWSDILPVCNCNGDLTTSFINPTQSHKSSMAEVWTSSMTELQILSSTTNSAVFISSSSVFLTPHDKAGELSSQSLSLEVNVAIAAGIMALISVGIVILLLIILKRTRNHAATRRDDFDCGPPKSPTETTTTMIDTNPGHEFTTPPLSNSVSSYFEIYSQEVLYYYALLCYR